MGQMLYLLSYLLVLHFVTVIVSSKSVPQKMINGNPENTGVGDSVVYNREGEYYYPNMFPQDNSDQGRISDRASRYGNAFILKRKFGDLFRLLHPTFEGTNEQQMTDHALTANKRFGVPSVIKRFSVPSIIKRFGVPSILKRFGGPSIIKRQFQHSSIFRPRFFNPSIIKRYDQKSEEGDSRMNDQPYLTDE